MMSDYERTMELVGYANNSAGASQKQFEKTLDSMESKLNQLHVAWETFTTGIADAGAIKLVVDLLTNLLNVINSVTAALDPFHTGLTKVLAAFLGFKGVKKIVNSALHGIGTQLGTRSADESARTFSQRFKGGIMRYMRKVKMPEIKTGVDKLQKDAQKMRELSKAYKEYGDIQNKVINTPVGEGKADLARERQKQAEAIQALNKELGIEKGLELESATASEIDAAAKDACLLSERGCAARS